MEPAVRGRLSDRFGWGACYGPLLFLPAPTRLAESVEMTRPAVRTWVGDAYSRWRRAPGGRCTLGTVPDRLAAPFFRLLLTSTETRRTFPSTTTEAPPTGAATCRH